MSENPLDQRVDRTAIRIKRLSEEGDDCEFWQTRTDEERLAATETMRQIVYGYDPTTERLQRVFRIVELGES